MSHLDYNSTAVPSNYICSKCTATSCKLWREYSTFNSRLYCASCAAKNQKADITTMNEKGQYRCSLGMMTDSIGWLVPAVPTAEGEEGYWGYTSVPLDGVEWWAALPTLP